MQQKSIKKIIPAQKVNMGGHIIEQPLPNQVLHQLDPFLLIHHAGGELQGNQRQEEVGLGGHPHRGFSPVTFIFQGDIHHRDSLGNDAVVQAGGTQWMHAGKGIIHSERPSAKLAQQGGKQEIIQFWVNTPAQYKMESPYYLPLSEEDTPKLEGEQYSIQVVAGEYQGIKGPAKTFSPMLLMRGHIETNGLVELNIPNHFNTLLYLLDGELTINGTDTKRKELVWFDTDRERITISANADTRFILLSGKPIGEQVVSYGPFVMNTQAEIIAAMQDAQTGKMGVLTEHFANV